MNSESSLDEQRVIAMMVGREVSQLFPSIARTSGEVIFEAKNISSEDPNVPGKYLVRDVSFSVRKGEVLGIAGLMGAGRTELLATLFGCYPGRTTSQIFVEGRKVEINNPADAIANGIAFVTEDRKRSGLVLEQTILRNITLAALPKVSGRVVTNEEREIAAGERIFRNLQVRANSLFTIARTLSGGNQQKVVLGKWLMTNPRVLFLDEPTRGIDVGAKQEIYTEIDKLAQAGLAVVMVSSELPEVLGLSDRILVLHEGQITGEFTRANATPEAVMACATGQAVHA
jgi:ABC-type sugar transport system ATPase subunit